MLKMLERDKERRRTKFWQNVKICHSISKRNDKKKRRKKSLINIRIEDHLTIIVLFCRARLTQTNMDHRSQHRLRQCFFFFLKEKDDTFLLQRIVSNLEKVQTCLTHYGESSGCSAMFQCPLHVATMVRKKVFILLCFDYALCSFKWALTMMSKKTWKKVKSTSYRVKYCGFLSRNSSEK